MVGPVRLLLFCCISALSASCAAAMVLSQAMPMLIDLAGSAFGIQHAKTLGGILNLMGSFSGKDDSQPSKQNELIEVDFDIAKQIGGGDSSNVMTLADGDVLTPKDNYKIIFTVSRPCYVYIFQIDSTTKIDIIVPEEGERQSFRPGETLYAPAGDDWFYLDENKGVEHVYLIASVNPILELEELLKSVREFSWQMRNKVSVEKPVVITKGSGGAKPGAKTDVRTKDGKVHRLDINKYKSSDKIVLTRWFKHE